jgi:hypothetical protein
MEQLVLKCLPYAVDRILTPSLFVHGAPVHAIDNEPAFHLERGGAACGRGNPAEALRYELDWASSATSKAESGH